ncbi:MAG: hypothetical protein LBL66_03015 [Clostridiales bacterium]|jgi:ABC-type sugar transport system permease subunit|nr:hypothetical protein [Clostridiales bacterium]
MLKRKTKNNIFVICLLVVPTAHFLVFWLYVNFSSLLLGFRNSATGAFSLEHFTRFFDAVKQDFAEGGGVKTAIGNTLITTAKTMFFDMPLTILATYVLFRKFFGHMFFRVAFYLPGIIGDVIIVGMTSYILGANGPVVVWGQKLGIDWGFDVFQTGLLGNSRTARPAFFLTAIGVSGGMVILLTGALSRIPKDLFDYGKLEGLGFFKELYYLIVPLIWSTIGIMWVMSFAGSWGDYSRVLLLTNGAYDTENFGIYMMKYTIGYARGADVALGYPAAIGMILTVVVLPVTLFLRWISNKLIRPVEF